MQAPSSECLRRYQMPPLLAAAAAALDSTAETMKMCSSLGLLAFTGMQSGKDETSHQATLAFTFLTAQQSARQPMEAGHYVLVMHAASW